MTDAYQYDQRVVDMYHQACNAGQATRNDFIQLLSNPEMGNIIVGTCVRVLLELQDFSEDYMVAKVQGIQLGDTYTGFSQNANQATTIHLKLQLPSRFSGGNGNLYQLNSISNSPLTRHEVQVWLSLTASEGRPEAQTFIAAGQRLRGVVPARQRRGAAAQQQQVQQQGAGSPAIPQPSSSNALSSTARQGGPNSSGSGALSAPTVSRRGADGSSPSTNGKNAAKAEHSSEAALQVGPRELVYQMILKEKNLESTLFKRTLGNMRTAELRTLERDVAEYLDRVREAIDGNQQRCVVCMDQIPTVIIMPCRHRVLCRWCTLKVESCPMCRGVATELFEPIEQ